MPRDGMGPGFQSIDRDRPGEPPVDPEVARLREQLTELHREYVLFVSVAPGTERSEAEWVRFDANRAEHDRLRMRLLALEDRVDAAEERRRPPGLHHRKHRGTDVTNDSVMWAWEGVSAASSARAQARASASIPWPSSPGGTLATPTTLWGTQPSGPPPPDLWRSQG